MTTNLIHKLAAQMIEVSHHTANRVHICHWENEIAARQSKHTLEVHPVFGIHTPEDIRKGFTTQQWDELGERIYNFIKEKQ